jgi:hypothetical protein
MSWTTKWACRRTGAAIDLSGRDGDLDGAHLRWNVVPEAAGTSQLILRATAAFQNGSTLLRSAARASMHAPRR